MSASIYWRPQGTGESLSVTAPQSFMEMVREALERNPFDGGEMTPADIPVLRGCLAGLSSPNKAGRFSQGQALLDLIHAIEKYGTILIDVRY